MGCTTVIVGKGATINGSTMIARTCDAETVDVPVKFIVNPPCEDAQVFHSYVTGLDIPLPKNAMRYQLAPFVEYKKHGQYGECGINSANVAMSATESIYGNPDVLALDPLVKTGLGEDALLSVVLPFIHSAREGVQYLGKLIARYGSNEGNGVIFSDKNEVWYMEIVTGHHWVASKLADDHVAIMANQVSQEQIDFEDPENFMWSAGLQEFVEEHSLNPDFEGFNFRHIFGTSTAIDRVYNTPRVWFGQNYLGHYSCNPESNDLPYSFKPARKIKHEDLGYILSSHYNETKYDPLSPTSSLADRTKFRPIALARCAEGHILEIRNNVPDHLAGITWFNFAPTAFNPFVPFYANANDTATSYHKTSLHFNPNQAYWAAREIAALIGPNYHEMKSMLIDTTGFLPLADQLSQEFIAKTDEAAKDLVDLAAREYLTQANEQNAQAYMTLVHQTIGKFIDKNMELSKLHYSVNTDNMQ